MPLSPSTSSLTSPKGLPPNPNLNPFSALSPDLEPRALQMLPAYNDSPRPLVHYSRTDLLRLAKRQRSTSTGPPSGMNPLDAWFGPTGSHAQVNDPAIASIGGPPSRSGGFGEGFGFGGGIGGGKALGRGARLGTRRTNDTQAEAMGGSQMGRFSTKPSNDRHRNGEEIRKEAQQDRRPKRDGEWRRQEPLPPSRNYNPRGHQHQPAEEVEPAWMDDAETFGTDDPAIAGTSAPDGLVHFVPGEDMIAAHRKDRHAETWRTGSGPKPLVSFFGAAQTMPSEPVKTAKVFNAANYLLPSKGASEEVEEDTTPAESSTGFQSRFQRFFAGAPPGAQQQEDTRDHAVTPHKQFQPPQAASAPKRPSTETPQERVDDHMAKLMGLLSAKSPPVPSPSPSHQQTPPGFGSMSPGPPTGPHHYSQHVPAHPSQHLAQLQHPSSDYLHSHLPDPRQGFYPAPQPDYRQYPSYPGVEHTSRGPDAQQLLANVSQRPPPHPGHLTMPPPPGMAQMDVRSHQRPPYPDMVSPHDLLRDLQYPREYAPKPPQYGHPPPFASQHFAGAPPPHAQQMPQFTRPPPHLNDAQQDMLATLFAGLPGPSR